MQRFHAYGPSLLVLLSALAVLTLGPTVVRNLTHERIMVEASLAAERLEEGTVLDQFNAALRDIAIAVEPSVVHISATRERPDFPGRNALSSGSGWIYDTTGHVVTNHHVVARMDRVEVQLHDGEIRPAEVIGSDPSTDIAVLRIDPARTRAATRAENLNDVEQGDFVFAFGSPFDFRFSMSAGIVSGKGRSVGVIQPRGSVGYENFIQVDAAINPGNSGGPLTDHRGQVIGMNTAIATGGGRPRSEEGQFAGIGLAIPLAMIEPVVTQIIENGFVSKGFLGVEMRELEPADRVRLGWNGRGVRVARVVRDSPASRGDMRVDDIITVIDGEVVDSVAGVRSLISSRLPTQVVSIEVQRRDPITGRTEPRQLQVTLIALGDIRGSGVIPNGLPEVGIRQMRTMTADIARAQEIPFHAGVVVLEWVPGSRHALDPGVSNKAIITHVMKQRIMSVEMLFLALENPESRVPRNRNGVPVDIINPDGTTETIWLRDETSGP